MLCRWCFLSDTVRETVKFREAESAHLDRRFKNQFGWFMIITIFSKILPVETHPLKQQFSSVRSLSAD